MTDELHDARWNEFETLGEQEVRTRLARHIWLEDKERLARQWLEWREATKALENRRETVALAREANDLAKRANDLAKEANDVARSASDVARTNNFIAALALVGAGIAIVASVIGLSGANPLPARCLFAV